MMITIVLPAFSSRRPTSIAAAMAAPEEMPMGIPSIRATNRAVVGADRYLGRCDGHPREKGTLLALEVHETGRAILLTTSREHAELKQDQIHAFGPDPLSSKDCKGSMTSVIEPGR